MYGSDKVSDDSERTAFRRAEKKYKLYYDPASKKKKQPKKVDLSEVLDFKSILESYNENGELPNGFNVLRCDSGRPVFSMESHPGFYFLPGALNIRDQCKWIKESLTSFPQPPNRTNHNAFYGPINGLFLAATERKILVEEGNSSANLNSGCNVSPGDGDVQRWKFFKEDVASSRGNTCKSISASVLLRKLRWSTLGLQFDWSKACDTFEM